MARAGGRPSPAVARHTGGVPTLVLQVLPLALGAAVSPTVLMIELLILSGARSPKARAWAFVVGVVVVLVAATALFLTVLSKAPDANGGSPAATWRIVDGVAAALLVALGVRNLLPKKTPGEKHKSRVAERLTTAGLPFYVGIGAVTMLTNFSTLILLAPACHEITKSTEAADVKALATAVLVGIILVPLLAPVLSMTLLGHRSDAVLARLNEVVSSHSRQINAGICFLLGVLLAWKAIR